ncbi:MAG: hypothetical protein ACI4A3_09885 [Lachnospiraceae bacterium]
MEIIRGNLLVLVTAVGMYLTLFLLTRLSDGPFERAFSFCREKNRKKEQNLAIRLVTGTSVGCIVLYYLLCALLGGKVVPVYNLCFVVLTICFSYLVTVGLAIKKDTGAMAWGITVVFMAPSLIIMGVLLRQVKFDAYCGYAAVILFVIDILLGRNIRQHWKKGDI